jgi:ankyrin repeat protein
VLEALTRRGFTVEFRGADRLIAACARADEAALQTIAAAEPQLVQELLAQGGTLLAEFAGNNNTAGVRLLLELGVKVTAPYEGDPYFGIPNNSTALHVAAWKAWHRTVKFLIERGAPVNAGDGNGMTPLQLAVRACVDSYWTNRRSPESVEALLRAGASVNGISLPTGYSEIDGLLQSRLR